MHFVRNQEAAIRVFHVLQVATLQI